MSKHTPADEMRAMYCLEFDSGDPWGSVMGWRFKIADELCRRGSDTPYNWQYQSGAAGPPDPEDGDYDLSDVSDADLVEFGDELMAEADKLRAAGRDY